MTNPVIVRTTKYIPRNGGPVVYEVFEEVEINGRWISLDPRSPTPEEMQSADDKAIAQQRATIATLTAERDSLQSQLTTSVSTLTAERDSAVSQLTSANERIATLETRIAELTAEPEVPIVSRRQARLALLEMGFFEAVESVVYNGPKAGQIEYEADTWRRDNPTLIAMAKALGMGDEQIDQFFALAGSK